MRRHIYMQAVRIQDKNESILYQLNEALHTDDEQALMVKEFGADSAQLDFSLLPPSWDETIANDEQAFMVIEFSTDSAELYFSLCPPSWDEPIA